MDHRLAQTTRNRRMISLRLKIYPIHSEMQTLVAPSTNPCLGR
jgi:hypothetical protein